MKLDETTIDDEKENTCNGNGILEKPIAKLIQSSETSTETSEDMNDSGNSDPPGVGDLLMVDPNTSRHEEENGIHNGSKADDSTSVSSSSSNFPLADFQQDDLSDEEMTLRVSDDEDLSEPVINEPDSYFTSSPFPKQDDDKNKDEKPPSNQKDDTICDSRNSVEPKPNEVKVDNSSDSENINTSVKSDDKDSSLQTTEKSDKQNERPDKDSEKPDKDSEKPNKETEKPDKESEKPNKQSEKPDKETEKPDKEFEKPDKESEKSDKESEKPDKESEKPDKETEKPNKETEKPGKETEKFYKETEKLDPETSIESSDKSDDLETFISDLHEESKATISETETEKVTITELREEIEEFIKSQDEEMEIDDPKITKSPEKNEESFSQPCENKEKSINDVTLDTIKNENITDETDETENKESVVNTCDSLEITEAKIEPITFSEDEINNREIIQNSDQIDIKIEETNNTENIAEETTNTETPDPPETVSDETDNKQTETIVTFETIDTDISENKSETKQTDSFSCQVSNVSEKTEPEKLETSESETDKTEDNTVLLVPVENISNSEENSGNNFEDDKTENESENESLLMEIDSREHESDTGENNKEESDESILIDDDVEMKEDFDNKDDPKEDLFDRLKFEDSKPSVEVKEIKDGDIKEIKVKPDDAKGELKGEELKSDDARTSLKRSLDISSENQEATQDAKKAKINGVRNPEDPYIRMDTFRDFMSKKKISTLTRAELEHVCLQKMCEAITQTSKIGELNRKIMQQETRHEALNAKYTALTKQIRDLEVVHTRVLQEVRMKVKENNVEVTPVKITRSVGLQVSLQVVLGGRNRPQPQSPVLTPTPPPVQQTTQQVWKRKTPQQRVSLPGNVPSTPSSSISMPPPSKPPLRSPQQKGIKTLLPKVNTQQKTYPPAEKPKDNTNPSVLESYLQSPAPSTSKTVSPARKQAPVTAGSSAGSSSDSSPKVIDLTDEDDTQKASTSSAPSPSTSAIRVVSPQQLQSSTSTAVTSTTLPRLTYLVQGNTQQGQQVLLATSTAPTRPGQVRSTLMFKPVAPVQGQRLNLVRPASVPGVTVLSQSGSTIRPGQQIRFTAPVQTSTRPQIRATAPLRHPAPLPGPPPMQPSQPNWKAMPPKPTLKISRVGDGIVLSWRMQNNKDMSLYEEIGSYQLYAYQETNSAPSTDMWRKVGDVKALALPMACTLTQFTDGNKYHFAVRAVDVKSRVGPFSQPEQIALP